MTLDELLLALAACACPPRRVDRSGWRSTCPVCGVADAVAVRAGALGLVGVLPSCRCDRREILAAVGLDVER